MEAAIFKDSDPERAAKGRERFGKAAAGVERSLDGGSFLVGDGLTVADVMVSTALNFANRAGFGEALGDTVKTYIGALQERPAFQRARELASQLPAAAE